MSKVLRIRIDEKAFAKLNNLRGDKPLSTFSKEILKNATGELSERVKSEADAFAEFTKSLNRVDLIVSSLEGSDILKISEKTEAILKNLRRILREVVRANIAIEEFAKMRLMRSDVYTKYIEEIEKRLEGREAIK